MRRRHQEPNPETPPSSIKYYSIVSFIFLLVFAMVFARSETQTCNGGLATIGHLIFYSLAVEFLIGMLQFILPWIFPQDPVAAAKLAYNIFQLWTIFILTVFIFSQVYLFDENENCRYEWPELYYATFSWVITMYIAIGTLAVYFLYRRHKVEHEVDYENL